MLRCLEHHDYIVLSAGVGDEALALLEGAQIDLEISDFETVSGDRPQLPFLLCSGNALGTISPQVLEQPHRALLSKPFSEEALLLKMQGLLDTRQ